MTNPSNSSSEEELRLNRPINIGMLSLGCAKTLVDSETILGKLSSQQFRIVPSVTHCDVALLNTCTFIHDAQQESVDRILELIELKKQNKIRALVVMGCMVQRYPEELEKELNEVDAFIGSGEYQKIPEIVMQVLEGKHIQVIAEPGYLQTSGESRVALTPEHYRYIKISEGCDHICTFCTIPSFRGKHRSRTIDDVCTEASNLIDQGAKELILTGQDTTYFGKDHTGEYLLPKLVQSLDELEGLEWIRILYAYPSCITEELMTTMRDSKHLCHYLDMPLQHASDDMLLAMKRGITKRRTLDLIKKFRDYVPDVAIRTTFIVGFPGETDKDFEELLQFMNDVQFERIGIFKYSQEQGTPAYEMRDQVDDETKNRRYEEAMLLQQEISAKNNKRFVGSQQKVLIEAQDQETPGQWVGRTEMDAPDVDGNVFVKTEVPLRIGQMYRVDITESQEYDLIGTI